MELGRELGLSFRALARRPGYSFAVVATLALGIGAATAVYALLDRVLLRPLPFPDADRILLVRNQNAGGEWNTSVVDFQALSAQATTFQAVAAMRAGEATLTDGAEPKPVAVRAVTAKWFEVIGVMPALGRGFAAGEDAPGQPARVVVSASFAAERFAGRDPLGQTIALDGVPHEVVGVMPAGFERLAAVRADLWPVLALAEPKRRGPFFLGTVARLAPGATLEQARAELDAISTRIFPIWQQGFRDESARLSPRRLQDQVVRGVGDYLWLATGAVLLVLLIATLNAANLATMRVAERDHELAVHAALGATRGRLARLLLVEGLALAAIGGALGIALAAALLELYRALGPQLPRLVEVALDARLLGVAASITLACGAAVGLLPLLLGLRGERALGQGRGAAAERGRGLLRDGMVALEFALALPLLVSAALLALSLLALSRVDTGIAAPEQLLTAKVRLLARDYADDAAQRAFWQRALPELRALPGVEAVAVAGAVPPSCGCNNNYDLLAKPAVDGEEPQAPWIPVGEGYFEALGLKLLSGRSFGPQDTPDSAPVLVVSAAWAARHFPEGDAVGQQLHEGGDRSRALTVIGVVADVPFDGVDAPAATVFAPVAQGWGADPAYLHLRVRGDAKALVAPLGAALRRLDPALAPTEVATGAELLGDSLAPQRHWAAVLAGFALAAVLLAAVGAGGVLAYYVARQRRELGVRLALGAQPSTVARLVLGRGLGLAAAGCAVGLLLAFALTRGIESVLFGVSRLDPAVFAAMTALLLVIAALACALPARRAASIEPTQALREE